MKGGGWVRGWRITRLLIEYQLDSNSVDHTYLPVQSPNRMTEKCALRHANAQTSTVLPPARYREWHRVAIDPKVFEMEQRDEVHDAILHQGLVLIARHGVVVRKALPQPHRIERCHLLHQSHQVQHLGEVFVEV